MNFKYFFLYIFWFLTIADSSMFGMYRLPAAKPLLNQGVFSYKQASPSPLIDLPQAKISHEQIKQLQEELLLERSKPSWTNHKLVSLPVLSSGTFTGPFSQTRVNLAPKVRLHLVRSRLMSQQEALHILGLCEKDLKVSATSTKEDYLESANVDKSLLVGLSALGFRNKPWVEKAMNKGRSAQSNEEKINTLEAMIALVRLDNLNHYSLNFLENTFPKLLQEYVNYYSDVMGNYDGPLRNPKSLLDATKQAAAEVRFRQEAAKRIAMAEAHENLRIMNNKTEDKAENVKDNIMDTASSWFKKVKNMFNTEEKSDQLIPLDPNDQLKR